MLVLILLGVLLIPASTAKLTELSCGGSYTDTVICLVNQIRINNNLVPLTEVPQLELSATEWASSMNTTGIFDHGDFASRITSTGYNWQLIGENIAEGYVTPQGVVNAWMNSPEHKANILDPAFVDTGVGYINGYWVQDFGEPVSPTLNISAPLPPQPKLRDIKGKYIIGCGFDGEVSAPEVCIGNFVVGVYIDDTTPNQRYWVNLALQKYKFVIAAIPPGRPHLRYRGALNAQEWYPYGSGYQWPKKPPKARAYIIQWYFAYPGSHPPTRKERHHLLSLVQSMHPKLILLY